MFLSEQDLSNKVCDVMAGNNPRMAVAFLGKNLSNNLFSNCKIPENLKVICDIEMGGTNPDALEELRVPNNDNVRHLEGKQFHTKIYLSDNGVVIGSINASNISLNEPEKRIEAGVFFEQHNEVYNEMSKWFDEKWEISKTVCNKALINAAVKFQKPKKPLAEETLNFLEFNLLEILQTNPEAFGGVKFIISDGDNDNEIINKSMEENNLMNLENLDSYEGWTKDPGLELKSEDSWPDDFIAIHRDGKKEISIQKYEKYSYDPKNDVFFCTEIDWSKLGNNFSVCVKLRKPNNSLISELENMSFFECVKSNIYTAEELSELLFN